MTLTVQYVVPANTIDTEHIVDVTGAVRLGSISGLSAEAEMGAVGVGNIVLDDPNSDLGYLGNIVGLKKMIFLESDCPVNHKRLYSSWIQDRRYRRGQDDSLILGVNRKIDCTLSDLNSLLSFRVFAPVALEPTWAFVRGAETDIARITALLAVAFVATALFDTGYVNATGPVNMDANDYTGSTINEVLNDLAQQSGKNFFVFYDEVNNKNVLWYDFYSSDGTGALPYDSTLLLTNVLSEVDGITTFAIQPDAVGTLDPSRVVAGVYLPYTGGTTYRKLVSTADTYAYRDKVAPSVTVKSLTIANARADRYLTENATEDNRISCTVQLPSSKVTLLMEGMRVQAHFTHLPGVSNTFTWCRVLQRTIRQDQLTEKFYWLDLELSPGLHVPAVEQYYTWTEGLGCFASAWPNPPGAGNLMISFAAARGGPVLADASTIPIGNTGTPGATCDPAVDVGGTGWSFVAGSAFNISAPGSDFPGYPVALAYRVGVAGEPQTDRWRTSGTQRVHYVEIAGLTGAPTATATLADQNRTSAPGETWTSPDLVSPGAGYWFCGYSSNLRGISDGNGTNGIMTAIAPAVDLTKGYQSGDYSPYSWFGYLKVAGAGTDHVVLVRNYGGWIHDDAGWTCAFWPL